jgi:hypothetical protein
MCTHIHDTVTLVDVHGNWAVLLLLTGFLVDVHGYGAVVLLVDIHGTRHLYSI